MRKIDNEQDFIANPKDTPREEYTKLKVGDRVTFTMPWMGGRASSLQPKSRRSTPYRSMPNWS
ncbi:MAG: hypothetical protein ACHQX3_12175, partial [Nitrospirales bacterium]